MIAATNNQKIFACPSGAASTLEWPVFKKYLDLASSATKMVPLYNFITKGYFAADLASSATKMVPHYNLICLKGIFAKDMVSFATKMAPL